MTVFYSHRNILSISPRTRLEFQYNNARTSTPCHPLFISIFNPISLAQHFLPYSSSHFLIHSLIPSKPYIPPLSSQHPSSPLSFIVFLYLFNLLIYLPFFHDPFQPQSYKDILRVTYHRTVYFHWPWFNIQPFSFNQTLLSVSLPFGFLRVLFAWAAHHFFNCCISLSLFPRPRPKPEFVFTCSLNTYRTQCLPRFFISTFF